MENRISEELMIIPLKHTVELRLVDGVEVAILLAEDYREAMQQRDDAIRDRDIHTQTIEYVQAMMMRLPLDFGSNNLYESCDQIERSVRRLKAALSHVQMYLRQTGWLRRSALAQTVDKALELT